MRYIDEHLKEIIFPLGGIGTGSIGLAGNGSLVDWEIFNRPNKGSLNDYSHFAIRAAYPDGRSITKVLQGDQIKDLMGQYSKTRFAGYGYGPRAVTMHGFPHFRHVTFDGDFPIAVLTFEDDDFPAVVTLKAFNPLIPLDADNSGLPAAFFDISIKSKANDITYTVVLTVRNPFEQSVNQKLAWDKYTAVRLQAFGKEKDALGYGDLTVAVDDAEGLYQEYWYRGKWRDAVTTFWHDLTTGTLENRHYDMHGNGDQCCVGSSVKIGQGASRSIRFLIAWNVPNNHNDWNAGSNGKNADYLWKNYYATQFADSAASCLYALENWDTLAQKTEQFRDSLHTSTLDHVVIDAISSTLSVLKSATVWRLEDGTFYGWEGVHEQSGSCEGTCTHVWSYQYALCFLFPELERSLRDTEFRYDTDADGRMYFRTFLPRGKGQVVQPPCVDGQMATIFKIYRDWKLTGNTDWLRDNWDNVKKVLEYAWSDKNTHEWDRDKDGVLEGRQHHTLDMELFGPSAWLEGMYLAALKAASEMAAFLGDAKKAEEYSALFESGYRWTKKHLFNGSYFSQKVDLTDHTYIKHFDCPDYWNEERNQLKYQIGEGSEIDQMLGQWHANICGLGDIFDKTQRRTALQSMMQHNFKPSMRNITNMWRLFAINDEAGTIMCDYPDGCRKPVIPITYCEECMTGFEYAFAGLLISEGMVEDGLKVVRAIRDRYDGKKRNPWNEIECGYNYARAMASYALLPIFSGFTYDLPHSHIGFAPIIPGDFKCLWSVGTGWGDFVRTAKNAAIILHSGSLTLTSVSLDNAADVQTAWCDGKQIAFTRNDKQILFDTITVRKELKFTY